MSVLFIDEGRRPKAVCFVCFPYEHRPALGIGVQGDGRQSGIVLNVVLANRVDEAHGRLTSIDDRDALEVRASHLSGPERGANRIHWHRFGCARQLGGVVVLESHINVAGLVNDVSIEALAAITVADDGIEV